MLRWPRPLNSILVKSIQSFLGVKGDIIKIKFEVEGRAFEAYVPDDQYWISIKDILLNREYEYIPEFGLNNFNGLIVDAGAHVGIFSLVSSVFARRVIALEPHPINYRLLEINIEKNKVNNVTAINRALWNEKGKLKIFEGSHSGEHSIYNSSNEFFEASTMTLRDVIVEYGNIDLLKIDIEGSEFNIFEGLGEGILKHINAIVGEIHLSYGDIGITMQNLSSAGFDVHTFRPPLWRKKNAYSIRLHGLSRLKLLRNFLYFLLPLVDFDARELLIIFVLRV